jgi:hypothetical protein
VPSWRIAHTPHPTATARTGSGVEFDARTLAGTAGPSGSAIGDGRVDGEEVGPGAVVLEPGATVPDGPASGDRGCDAAGGTPHAPTANVTTIATPDHDSSDVRRTGSPPHLKGHLR